MKSGRVGFANNIQKLGDYAINNLLLNNNQNNNEVQKLPPS